MTLYALRPLSGADSGITRSMTTEAVRCVELRKSAVKNWIRLPVHEKLTCELRRICSVVRPLMGLFTTGYAGIIAGFAEQLMHSRMTGSVRSGGPPVNGPLDRVDQTSGSPPSVIVGLAPTGPSVFAFSMAPIDGTSLHPITSIAGGLYR